MGCEPTVATGPGNNFRSGQTRHHRDPTGSRRRNRGIVRPARHPIAGRAPTPPCETSRVRHRSPQGARRRTPSRPASAGRMGTSRCPSPTTPERAPHEEGGSRVRLRRRNPERPPPHRSRPNPRVRTATARRSTSAISSLTGRERRPRDRSPADSSARECAGNDHGTERVSPTRERSRSNNGRDERERDGTRTRDSMQRRARHESGRVSDSASAERETRT